MIVFGCCEGARAHLEQDLAEAPEVSGTLTATRFLVRQEALQYDTPETEACFLSPGMSRGRVSGRGEDEDTAHPLMMVSFP